MEKERLIQYIQDAIMLETDVATQTQLIEQSKADMATREPVLRKQRELKAVRIKEPPSFWTNGTILSSIFSVGLFIFGMPFLGSGLVDSAKNVTFVSWCIAALLLCYVARAYYLYEKENRKLAEENEKKRQQYIEAQESLRIVNEQLQKEYVIEYNEWLQSGNSLIDSMTTPLNQTQNLLARFYADETIYPKYRTLPALTSIYEYFITGRCDELTGPHGAYNLYEDELRKDTVISQLNTVIENLEQIKNNQYMLYQQVKAIQQNTAVIASELQQIKGYTIQIAELSALNAYYAALNERNTRITMYYHL